MENIILIVTTVYIRVLFFAIYQTNIKLIKIKYKSSKYIIFSRGNESKENIVYWTISTSTLQKYYFLKNFKNWYLNENICNVYKITVIKNKETFKKSTKKGNQVNHSIQQNRQWSQHST